MGILSWAEKRLERAQEEIDGEGDGEEEEGEGVPKNGLKLTPYLSGRRLNQRPRGKISQFTCRAEGKFDGERI